MNQSTDATWEPIENLAGCGDFIARFNKEQDTKNRLALEEQQAKAAKRKQDNAEFIAKKEQLKEENNAVIQDKLDAKKERDLTGSRSPLPRSQKMQCDLLPP